jgi:hypothetical protein
MDVPHRGLRATVRHRLPPELLGFQVNFGLEQGATPITAVLKDSQGSCCHTMEVCGRQDILQKTWAPIEELLDDEVMVHGVPPDEKVDCLGFHQDTLWTTYLQFKGTP